MRFLDEAEENKIISRAQKEDVDIEGIICFLEELGGNNTAT